MGSPGGIVFIETRERAPREFYITYEDVKKYKITRGCGGCSSFTRGLGRQPHTDACRERFRDLMKDEVKVKQSEERKREFEERQKDKKGRRKRRKKTERGRRKEKKKRKKHRKQEDLTIRGR